MLPSERLRRSIANRFHAVNKTATVVCTLLFAAAAADAHPEFAPATVNRYLKLDLVGPDELRLAYTTMVGPAPAAAWRRARRHQRRRQARRRRDRAPSASARRAGGAGRAVAHRRRQGGHAGVRDTRGRPGRRRGGAEPVLGRSGGARAARRRRRRTRVRLDDATPEPQLGETEIRVEESPATRLLASHRGPIGDEKEPRFVFRGPKFSALEDRSITVVFAARVPALSTADAPAPPMSRAWRWARWLVAAALLGGLVVMAILVRTKRRSRSLPRARAPAKAGAEENHAPVH